MLPGPSRIVPMQLRRPLLHHENDPATCSSKKTWEMLHLITGSVDNMLTLSLSVCDFSTMFSFETHLTLSHSASP